MSTRKTETGKPAAPLAVETKDELTDGALENVSGGDRGVALQDIHFTKVIDKSSPNLFVDATSPAKKPT
jgi:type VI protein secretion system component Hcp